MTEPPSDQPRCRLCPVAPGTPCAGSEVPRFCELIDPGRLDYNPAYLAHLQSGSGPALAPRRSLGETLRLLRAMKSCPDRDERTDCGCGGLASCSRGKGRDGLVHSGDCFDCLDAGASSKP